MIHRPLVILHGWSDTGDSFGAMARHLSARLPGVDISIVSIGDYMSMSDEIRFDDLQQAMHRAWIDRRLAQPRQCGRDCSFNGWAGGPRMAGPQLCH